ncbi:hypothetical protein [Asanoa iriomotensis]|uniref:Uncharacterized protein n=1 Tax=Asanoa iriomotensis TaxID=234613 RepID=A0ABQ4CDR5_9ACTN|nr:hypothetical protein [Asanoa iriomotensis]GIF60900.1 hypothetical protein Air01nite_69950 [Asanoa iriomotensis]
MIRRLTPYLLVVLTLAGGLAALSIRPATAETRRSADYVVVVGIPGLRWDDVTEQGTPNLWRLAERGSIGSLSVRSALKPTCPVDGWLTLGAGNYAGWRRSTAVTDGCPPLSVDVQRPDGIGAFLPDLDRQAVAYNESLTWGAVPGALPQSVRCTSAIGPGAAVAAARPYGRVDNYEPELPANPGQLLSRCILSMVDLGTVSGDDPAVRATAAARADATLARVLAARPDRSLVLVAGLADTDQSSRLHVAIADGPGWEGGWLTSPSTGRDGYVQLVDLAPTALLALNRPRPERLFVGQPATSVPGRPEKLPDAVTFPADADREAGAQRSVATWFFGILAVVQLVLAVAVVPLLRRARRHAGDDHEPVRKPISDTVEVLLVAAALAIPAALVADLVPWWRGGQPGWLFAAVMAFVLAVGTTVVRFAPAFRHTLGPLAMVVTVAAVVVGVDLMTGARLQLNGVAGYSVLEDNRYAGVGTVGLGVFVTGVLLGAGALAQRFARSWRPLVVVLIGGLGIFLVGSPYLGADPIGAVALTAGVCIATALSTGGWLTLGRLAGASVAGVAVTAVFAWIETRRPEAERGSLGRFVSALGDGTGGTTLQRTSKASFDALANSPLTLLALVGAALLWLVLLRHWGGLRRAYGLYPAIRAGAVGIGVAVLLGGVLGGTGLELAGAAAAVAVPMAALTALRVLNHASDFTRPTAPETTPEATPDAEPEVAKGVGAA